MNEKNCAWPVIAAWIDGEGTIRLAGKGTTPEIRIFQKTDEIHVLERLCEVMKQNGVSKCKPLLKLDEPQTSYISITKGSDVAIILDNIMPFVMVGKKVQEAKIVREFLSKRKRKPV